MDKLGIYMSGANGKMGRSIIQVVMASEKFDLLGACDRADSPVIGADAGLNANAGVASVTISADLNPAFKKNKESGVIIDFSAPSATLALLEDAIEFKTPVIIGTTGFSDEQKKIIESASKSIPIVFAPNMSLAVNVMFYLASEAARLLGDDSDIEILEAHHNQKKDAPSGTALKLAQVICEATSRNVSEDLVYEREGLVGERTKKEIGMQVIRGGDIVGEHTVYYCGKGERVEITHRATDRLTFAHGALRAALWVSKKEAGLYGMNHVLGIK